MKKVLCLIITLLVVFPNSVFATTYTDVEENSDFGVTLDFLTRMGIINGYDDGSFMPKNTLTRAEAATIICKLINSL